MKRMETIRRIKIIDVLKREDYGSEVNVKGWVRTRRGSKSVHFIALNDGSTINNVQVVADADKFDDELIKLITTGACLSVTHAFAYQYVRCGVPYPSSHGDGHPSLFP